MPAYILWPAVTIILALIFHLFTIALFPYAVVVASAIKTKRKSNVIYHAPPTTVDSRDVVRPCPDLLYSGCSFDISKKPLFISAPIPLDTYFSISGFAVNTDNFFTLNDRQISSPKVNIVLISNEMQYHPKENEKVVVAPSKKGVVFFRTLVKHADHLQQLISTHNQIVCSTLEYSIRK